ncbi:MAG: Fibronectin, type domain protein, partial [Acidobacteria bacterium]|nr:Fibronectin, type domain protein [Acidobacteriota bacterium]
GVQTLYAWAKDAAGNVGGQSKSITITTTAPDTTAPAVTLNMPGSSTSLTVTISVSATDAVGVTGYLVNQSATVPAANATGWTASAPTGYTFAGAGVQTLYAWAKDAAGNVGGQSKSITITTTSSDTIAPVVTSFSIPGTAISLTVAITSFDATDNIGVTGYMVTEVPTPPSAGSTNWISRAPTSHTFSAPGEKTLYAWAKDAAGNVSTAKSSNTTITGTGQDQSEMAVWAGKWFRLSIQNVDEDSVSIGYLNILSWDEANQMFRSALYTKDESSQWRAEELMLHYTSGGPLRFLGWSNFGEELTFTFRVVDDEENEKENERGIDRSFAFSGSLISADRIPSEINNPMGSSTSTESPYSRPGKRGTEHKARRTP